MIARNVRLEMHQEGDYSIRISARRGRTLGARSLLLAPEMLRSFDALGSTSAGTAHFIRALVSEVNCLLEAVQTPKRTAKAVTP